jgi:hypothetical protein
VDGRPIIIVTMGGFRVSALVDTGASSSLLREDIFLAMANRVKRAHYIKESRPLQGISGKRLPLVGCTEVPLAVEIITSMGPELIIGQDWLTKGGAVINFPRKVLRWFGQEWPVQDVGGVGTVACTTQLPCMGYPEGDQVIRKYADVFSGKAEPNRTSNLPPLRIHTTGGPIALPAYRAPLTKRKLIDEKIEEMLADGVIRPSSSPWAAPVTLVPKKDGSTRFCTDFRRLNEVTVKDQFPLPHIQDVP